MKPAPVTPKTLIPLLALALLTGCSADFYERQADRDVQAIVKERQDQTLGYRPQVDAERRPEDSRVTPQAYAKIPQTPILPPAPPQVEPLRVRLDYAPLGPRRFAWADNGDAPASQSVSPGGYATLDARIHDRLQAGPPTLEQRPVKLDFFGALSYGTQHSRTYQGTMEDLYLAALNVTLQRHLFEPRFFAGPSLIYNQTNDAGRTAALTTAMRVGVRQQLPYGGEIVAQGLVNFVDAIQGNAAGGESASLVLNGTIPLLRGFGMVNLEPLISGERELVYQVRTFENFRRDFVIDLATQYFRLINLQQSVLDRRVNYASFVTLTERSRALFAAGRVASIELQRSLQELLSSENQLLNAQENYTAALDDFKLFLGMPTEQAMEVVPVELDVDLPNVTEDEAVALALRYRLDLQTARDRSDDARRRVENAKNGLLPDLTLSGTAQIGNRAGTAAANFDDPNGAYVARVDLDLPIDRVAERNTYRTALITVRRAERNEVQLKDQISSDVRESLRLIRQSQLTLQIQRRGIELAQARRENAYELLRSGKSTSTRDLVEAQNSLLTSLDQFEQARATLQVNVLRFLRNSGTLRLDPHAGEIGHALDRLAEAGNAPGRALNNPPPAQ